MGDALIRAKHYVEWRREAADAGEYDENVTDALALVVAVATVPDAVIAFARAEVEAFTPHPNDSDAVRVAFVDTCKWLSAVAALRGATETGEGA
jgi:hypothetical protein